MLATTPDESIGRSFDKVSRMLELEWSSNGPGAALEQFCATGDSEEDDDIADFPSMPKVTPGRLMFSYSGLHSIVERYITRQGGVANLDINTRRALARAFQTAAVAQLEEKLGLGLAWCTREQIHIRHVVVSGGVASNSFLRARQVSWNCNYILMTVPKPQF
jgi:N6-L-threonylcarbamoyladenine synthase